MSLAMALILLPAVFIKLATPPPEVASTAGQPRIDPEARYRVYVAGWGYHTSVILEQPAGFRLGPPGEEDAPFVEFAWGNRSFYMESNYWPHSIFAAVFLPTPSVTYVDGWKGKPVRSAAMRELYVRYVSANELASLVESLEESIVRLPGGQRTEPHPPVAGYSGRFYPAREYYIFWFNCNAWTVERLRSAGVAGSSRFVFTEQQVKGRLWEFLEVS